MVKWGIGSMTVTSCIFAVDLYEIILEVSLLFICTLIHFDHLWNIPSVVWREISWDQLMYKWKHKIILSLATLIVDLV